ncbi:MAG: S41 family peptidase [Bacteroidota bacterium]|nr:S41 family peptidase [Bacteroidota bacterium]
MTQLVKRMLLCFFALASVSFMQAQQASFAASPATVKMNMALYAIKNLYVDNVQEDKLVEEGIKAMVKKLDPHSAYMTAEEMKEMNEPLMGGFDGIGISFNMLNDTLFVVEVIAGGPSEKVGLLPGDRIMTVDGTNIAGVNMSNKDIMKRLKGPKGTMVTLQVKRRANKDWLTFRIIRDKIPLYSLDASFMLDNHTGYIKLNRFGATTVDEFREAFATLKKQGMENLVLDLQSNGGGLMNAAVDLADEFLSGGKCIVYTKGLHSPRMQSDATSKGLFETGKLVILIDEYSASASEILSGAIQDWDRGLIVGRRSFGKGLVQRPIDLPDGSSLKLTVSRYYTPSGRFIQKPYENIENYSSDLIDRYNRGEMIHADSIHFPDSLKTKTLLNKRTIYGGGGIMPDVFVPLDTTKYSHLYKVLITSGTLNRFSLEYIDAHRQDLIKAYPTDDAFDQNFAISDSVMHQLLAFAKTDSVGLNKEDSLTDQSLLKRQLKGFMARDLWKSSDYYKVMSIDNEPLMKALELLNDKKSYAELLKRKSPTK